MACTPAGLSPEAVRRRSVSTGTSRPRTKRFSLSLIEGGDLGAELLARYGIPEPEPQDTPITAGARLIEYDPDAVEKPARGREVRVPRSERQVILGHWGRRTGRHVEKMGLDLVPGRRLD